METLILSATTANKKKTYVDVKGITIGQDLAIIAGPCSVENEEQIIKTAIGVKKAGANILRGGAFKPRSLPYSFQGLGVKGLHMLAKAGLEAGLPIISEVLDIRDIDLFCKHVDIIQIGSRNMQNFALLREVGKTKKPILLKRGLCATYAEWLGSAEYILSEGNEKIILCERGIRTIESYTRNILDIAAIPAMRELTHLPIIVDPSHGTGRSSLVEAVSLAAIAAGADGLMIEVHVDPANAQSDAEQQISVECFAALMEKVNKVKLVLNYGHNI